MAIHALVIEDFERKPGLMNLKQLAPSWEQVQAAIRQLEGEKRSLIMLCASEDCSEFMGVGGGDGGRYCCFIVDANGDEYGLIDPSLDDTQPTKFLMGEISTRPRNELVATHQVLDATKWYFHHAVLHPQMKWRRY